MRDTASRRDRAASLGFLFFIVCAASGIAAQTRTPEAIIRQWPQQASATAKLMIEAYGKPDQFDANSLVWFNNGSWKRTIVYRKALRRGPGGKDGAFLQQTIGYLLPADRVASLERFSPMISVSATGGELSFISESEATNRLALNLADEIVTGKRTVADARSFFAKTHRLANAGKSSSYLEGLRFDVDNARSIIPTGADQ